MTWRNGSKVNVVMVRDGGRVMERKWFAVLGLVVKQCNVPWQNKDQASEAVKLALGIVNLSKTVRGDFMAYPKSLVELTDPELDEAVRDMMDLIQKMTGIDPATLKKEAADVGEDEQETPVAPHAAGDGSDGSQAPQASPAVAAAPSEPAPASDPSLRSKLEECRDKILRIARETDLSDDDRRKTAKTALEAWRNDLPAHRPFVEACIEALGRIVKSGKPDTEKAERAYLNGLITRAAP